MRTRHRIRIRSACPVDGAPDRYTCDVYPDGLLYCEAVREAAIDLTTGAVTQEALTQQLADRLRCKVRTRGTHCGGLVETVCICWPRQGATP